ncbi:hypothetical protein AcW1_006365 [Taiwanofungus camphoratus]|nr:hypothetical protein AcV5_008951 [Antrodia cinnamomea]KAI0954485.1 hypothetical protein AcW1_006365 [Antrodia cinnamomea]
MKGRQPENRRENLRRWKSTPILSSFPILLHISLLLFFAGLLDFLWPINSTVAIVFASLVSATVFIYIVTHVLSLISVTCPFRTSVTSAILSSISSVSPELIADILSLIFTGALYAILLIKWLRSKGSTRNRERYAFAARLAGPSK